MTFNYTNPKITNNVHSNKLKIDIAHTYDKQICSIPTYISLDKVFLSECELKKLNVMDKPHCIFNCDESGVNSRIATREKAYGVRGETSYQEKVKSHIWKNYISIN